MLRWKTTNAGFLSGVNARIKRRYTLWRKIMKLIKYAGNPILSPAKNYWEERCVLNPAVVYDEKNEKFVMLYRAAGNDKEHIIICGLAESDDGINFKRVSKEPVF